MTRSWTVCALIILINVAIFAAGSPAFALVHVGIVLVAFQFGRDYEKRGEAHDSHDG